MKKKIKIIKKIKKIKKKKTKTFPTILRKNQKHLNKKIKQMKVKLIAIQ